MYSSGTWFFKNPFATFLQLGRRILDHLQWILKKDLSNQNIMLIGRPGPFKYRLAKSYLALSKQEMEYVCLHPDISSESDLKQRREIVSSSDGSKLEDGPLVKGAIHGRTVVIDGAERAERNVLPVLNNLLENREMNLEDGRRIVSHLTYDALLLKNSREQLDQWGLVRSHERFRVIALAAPTPTYPGKALDPPFRSRFQSRHVDTPIQGRATKYHQSLFNANIDFNSTTIDNLNMVRQTLTSARLDSKDIILKELVLEFDQPTVEKCRLLDAFVPLDFQKDVLIGLSRYYATSWIPKDLTDQQEKALRTLTKSFDLPCDKVKSEQENIPRTLYSLTVVEGAHAHFSSLDGKNVVVQITHGSANMKTKARKEEFLKSERCNDILTRMIQCHALHQDMILVGPKSSSKSICIRHFSDMLKYDVVTIYLYKEMTARDLLQRRATRNDGATEWEDSDLIKAAKTGSLAVLEGLQWLPASVSVTLSTLLNERQCYLPDGTLLVSQFEFNEMKSRTGSTDSELNQNGIFPIHPSFRVIATVTSGSSTSTLKKSTEWFSEEVGAMFASLQVDEMGLSEEKALLKKTKLPSKRLDKILSFAERFRDLAHNSGHASVLSNSISLSTRQLVRICMRALFEKSDLHKLIWSSCLGPFMTCIARTALNDMLQGVGIKPSMKQGDIIINSSADSVEFGDDVKIAKFIGHDEESKSMVPQSNATANFFDNASHSQVMRDLAVDFSLGEHLLLIGNQGVGKNKIIDRFLELLDYPREYIQLHRDSTVQSLLFQPILQNGKIIYEDSPLIKAVKFGRAIIIDEADKAPVHVISAIKSLAEDDGEMNLPDGRRIVSFASSSGHTEIPIHPKFRNTWMGGTGGSSTAGLGGRGGPYRLDSGNPIHQLPDHLKNDVPQKVLEEARKMGKDALKKMFKIKSNNYV